MGMFIYHMLMATLVGQMLKIALDFLNTGQITKNVICEITLKKLTFTKSHSNVTH